MDWLINSEWYGRSATACSAHHTATIREVEGHSVQGTLCKDGEVVMHKKFPSFDTACEHMEKHLV
jgi:hypothetical protein